MQETRYSKSLQSSSLELSDRDLRQQKSSVSRFWTLAVLKLKTSVTWILFLVFLWLGTNYFTAQCHQKSLANKEICDYSCLRSPWNYQVLTLQETMKLMKFHVINVGRKGSNYMTAFTCKKKIVEYSFDCIEEWLVNVAETVSALKLNFLWSKKIFILFFNVIMVLGTWKAKKQLLLFTLLMIHSHRGSSLFFLPLLKGIGIVPVC